MEFFDIVPMLEDRFEQELQDASPLVRDDIARRRNSGDGQRIWQELEAAKPAPDDFGWVFHQVNNRRPEIERLLGLGEPTAHQPVKPRSRFGAFLSKLARSIGAIGREVSGHSWEHSKALHIQVYDLAAEVLVLRYLLNYERRLIDQCIRNVAVTKQVVPTIPPPRIARFIDRTRH